MSAEQSEPIRLHRSAGRPHDGPAVAGRWRRVRHCVGSARIRASRRVFPCLLARLHVLVGHRARVHGDYYDPPPDRRRMGGRHSPHPRCGYANAPRPRYPLYPGRYRGVAASNLSVVDAAGCNPGCAHSRTPREVQFHQGRVPEPVRLHHSRHLLFRDLEHTLVLAFDVVEARRSARRSRQYAKI